MTLQDWASLATVLLCLEAFVVGLAALIAAYGLGRGMSYVLRELPRLIAQVRGYTGGIQNGVTRLSDSVVGPAFGMAGFVARAKGLWSGIRRSAGFRS